MADQSFNYHMNALFWPINLVDYERDLVGPEWGHAEFPNKEHVQRVNFDENGYMQGNDPSMTMIVDRETPNFGTTTRMDAKFAEIPEEVDDEKPDREDPDDEIVKDEWAYKDDRDLDFIPKRQYTRKGRDEYEFFWRNEKLQDWFNEKEIEGFLNLLNVKPVSTWTDKSLYDYAQGEHDYFDEAQQLDPEYHLVAEVMRDHAEKLMTWKFWSGYTMRF